MATHPADHRHSRPGTTRYGHRGATHLESSARQRTVIWYLPTSSGVCQGGDDVDSARCPWQMEQRSRLLRQRGLLSCTSYLISRVEVT